MSEQFIISLDQGTTSTRAMLVDKQGEIKAIVKEELQLQFPKPGWVEVDAEQIWQSTYQLLTKLLAAGEVTASHIAALGITNQRETTVIWDKVTGKPIYNAIVWQSRQTEAICEQLRQDRYDTIIHQKTGLLIDPYFSGTKIKWLLDHVAGARQKALSGQLLFGTIDTWLIWNLTGGACHMTDVSNASRTMLFNIHDRCWDEELLDLLQIPHQLLPEVRSSSEVYGKTAAKLFDSAISIASMAGDQQAALFGQQAFSKGDTKNTYGTGCFMLMNTGTEAVMSNNGLLTTIAWEIDGKMEYALEGSVFVAGAAISWLQESLQFIETAGETEALASQVTSSEGAYVVPAFVGLGTPYWRSDVRGAIFGLTRNTNRAHFVRAVLESLAYQSKDVLQVMELDAQIKLQSLHVDGGVVANNLLMQFQSDLLQVPVIRPASNESTALGAAYLAGLAVGFWQSKQQIAELQKVDRTFFPNHETDHYEQLYAGWKKAVKAAIAFAD
ncbi:glycerol kinase GlpK [Paenibacillus yanchengensis]|uniref:Glycerol kinase n=1 Tax=Paenibacillus yanchengensis TaxID=2035833 RepID=A0ABW4YP51_9BACL